MDCVYVNIETKLEIDVDRKFHISVIKQLVYDPEDQIFFILANKLGDFSPKLGFYVIKMSAVDPEDYSFMIKWKNKLDIGDANIHILRKDNLKEVIISFK